MKYSTKLISALLVTACCLPGAGRLKDLVSIDGVRDNQLIGYGLVVGLNGTGDRQQTVFSAQSLSSMLSKMGVNVAPTQLRVRNVAVVMATGATAALRHSRHAARRHRLVHWRLEKPARRNSAAHSAQGLS
ncbi:MAG: flagellar basal body P-ring protein FlgI [Bryobacterales bacterium]